MSFHVNIYNDLLRIAIIKTKDSKGNFNAYDIVHELYLLEDEITLDNCRSKMYGIIKKEICGCVNFTLQHQIFGDTYVCSKCKEPKPVAAFRIRTEVRDGYFEYVNDCCIECERTAKNQYDKLHKDSKEYKEKAAERANKWHWSNRELVLQYQKAKRETPEYKEMMRKYREKNREKIREQAKAARIKRNANKKIAHRNGLT